MSIDLIFNIICNVIVQIDHVTVRLDKNTCFFHIVQGRLVISLPIKIIDKLSNGIMFNEEGDKKQYSRS